MNVTTREEAPAVARLIRMRRLYLGFTQEQLARKMNVSTSNISRWERGNREPSRAMRQLLAAHLGGRPADYRTD